MPKVSAGDGVEIHYEERGSGPLVVLAAYWSMHPSGVEPVIAELERDHRVVRYDDRGTGESTRVGPYDLETATADLAALLRELDEPAVIVGVADGPSRAVRIAADSPEMVLGVVTPGGAPMGRAHFAETGDVLATSESVVEALLQQIETDYRGALRGLLSATNEQMSEDELRSRIAAQAEHCPVEAGAARLRAWASDDPTDFALATGDRLWVLVSDTVGGGWFPTGSALAAVVSRTLPDAHIEEIADGWVSRPDETAGVIRRITASVQVP